MKNTAAAPRTYASLAAAITAGAKGTDLVSETCGKCSGEGSVSWGANVNGAIYRADGSAEIIGRVCFTCNGLGTVRMQVRSLKARQARAAKAAAEAAERAARMESLYAARDAWKLANTEAWELIVELADQDRQAGLAFELWNDRTAIPTDEQIAKLREMKAKRDAAEGARRPVVEGPAVEVEGVIVSMKPVEGRFGRTWKMLILDDRGFKVWGSVPTALEDDVLPWNYFDENGERQHRPGAELGVTRVRFVAAVAASDRDFDFGFFKRPRKAQVL